MVWGLQLALWAIEARDLEHGCHVSPRNSSDLAAKDLFTSSQLTLTLSPWTRMKAAQPLPICIGRAGF